MTSVLVFIFPLPPPLAVPLIQMRRRQRKSGRLITNGQVETTLAAYRTRSCARDAGVTLSKVSLHIPRIRAGGWLYSSPHFAQIAPSSHPLAAAATLLAALNGHFAEETRQSGSHAREQPAAG